jgi:hypothetical protein
MNRLVWGIKVDTILADHCISVSDVKAVSSCDDVCPVSAFLETFVGPGFSEPPAIDVLETTGTNVTFAASQVFSDLTLCEVQVLHDSALTDQLECPSENSVPPGEMDVYTANCGIDGFARVSILVYDSRLESISSTAPSQCLSSSSGGVLAGYYSYLLPCALSCPLGRCVRLELCLVVAPGRARRELTSVASIGEERCERTLLLGVVAAARTQHLFVSLESIWHRQFTLTCQFKSYTMLL